MLKDNNTIIDYGYGTRYALSQAVSVATSNYRNGGYQSYTTTSNSYVWYSSAATGQIAYYDGQGHTYNTYYSYGSGGVLNSVYVADGRPHSIAFTNDMAGQALRRDESDNNYNQYTGGDPHEVWYRFDGRQLDYAATMLCVDAVADFWRLEDFAAQGLRLCRRRGNGDAVAFGAER